MDIAIFGTGSGRKEVESLVRSDCNITLYIDNYVNEIKRINSIPIIHPSDINKYNFSFIIIASQYYTQIKKQLINLGVEKEKIISYFEYKHSLMSENLLRSNIHKLQANTDCEVLITGLSYAFEGIKANHLKRNSLNFAMPSQDLYFDYYLTKSILNRNMHKNIKYQIIGISYYSFQYDLTRSSLANLALGYLFYTGKYHNLNNETVLGYKVFREKIESLLDIDVNGISFDYSYRSNILANLDKSGGKELAYKHSNKNYPETIKENIDIFKRYLTLLREHNILPIVTVLPVSKYYHLYFSREISEEFYNIMKEIQMEFRFEFIDLFSSDKFTDSDFYDFDHLNNKGAEKVTEILNGILG